MSKSVKSLVTLSTLLLCCLIVIYHAIEVQVQTITLTCQLTHLLAYVLCFLPTAVAWGVMQSPPSVRPSVRLSVRLFSLYLRNRPFACRLVMTIALRGLKVKVIAQGEGHGSG